MASGSEANRAANVWTARIIPILLVAILGYASYVVTYIECVNYLLRSSTRPLRQTRPGAAIAILTIYYVLLCFLLVSYARLVWTILLHPGVVPRGPQWYVEQEQKKRPASLRKTSEKGDFNETDSGEGVSAKGTLPDADSYRVQDFWLKDAFICQWDGRPKFCSHCYNYKVDRVHHCSELDRCIYKMDHFCPWVGGIVSETSFKFFIQFTFWGGLFCLFNLIHVAYFFAERQRHGASLNAHWLVMIGLSGLFSLFGMGMCGSSLQFAIENTSTIENLDKRTHVYYVAIYVPYTTFERLSNTQRDAIRWITYPRPPGEQIHLLQDSGADYADAAGTALPPNSQNLSLPDNASPQPQRTFAVLETAPGANPFDLGAFNNFKDVMGESFLDWVLPIKHSPCFQHRQRSPHSMYKLGRVVYKLKKRNNIAEDGDRQRYAGPKRKRRRKSSGSSATSDRHHRRWHGQGHTRPGSRSTTSASANESAGG